MESSKSANIHLYEKLVTLQHLLMRQRFARKGSGPLADPMRGQGRILALLKIKDGVSAKDMSSVLGIRTSSLNELISKLESKGYVVREQSQEDKRVMVVKLTDRGREFEQPSDAVGVDVFECLSEDEKRVFGEYLDRMIAHVGAQMGEARGDEGFEEILRRREEAFKKFFVEGACGGPSGLPQFGAFGFHGGFGGFDSREEREDGGCGQSADGGRA